MIKTYKHLKFRDIPGKIGNDIYNLALELCGSNALDYSAFEYEVGSFSKKYDKAHPNDLKHYPIDDVNFDREIVKWFESIGVKSGETVYIGLF